MPFMSIINLGFIGGGNMSTAIAQGIIKDNVFPAENIWVSGPHLENLNHWKDLGCNTTDKNVDVFNKCDTIFLGVKPFLLKQAIQEIVDGDRKHKKLTLFISMLAGTTLNELGQVLKPLEEGIFNVIRIMPNTPMMIGKGSCLLACGPQVPILQKKEVMRLLSCIAMCEEVAEPLIDSLGALTGCGPAFIYIMIEALADGAVKQGVPRATAIRFAAQMVAGSAEMVLQTGKHPGQLKDEVCSPGGSTICGVNALEDGKIRATFMKAIEASTLRNKEMGKK